MQGISAANHRAGSGLELGSALRACRGAFLGIGLITGMINVLYLTGSFFMLEVYDRVIPSRSMPTLVGLGVLAGSALPVPGLPRPDPGPAARPDRSFH
jgi:ATP-binding cassette subfamily C protein